MQVFRYSGPEFSPYGDDELAPVSEPGPWTAPTASGPLDASLRLPGSKSLTNRELVLSALASGPSLLRSPLHSRDSALMMGALASLGTSIAEVAGDGEFGDDLLITPGALEGPAAIDCGLAGTVMRFMPPVAALALGSVSFDGDAAARSRPMRATIGSLRSLGVEVSDDGRGALPFSLFGTGEVRGGDLEIDASASSQFVSGLLLAAPRFRDGLRLRHSGARLPSLPHIEMTIAALADRGITVQAPEPGLWLVPPGEIRGMEVAIEPDLSNAAPFLAAAIVAGGTVAIAGWPEHTNQVGARLAELMTEFGAGVSRSAEALEVDGAAGIIGGRKIPGVELDLGDAGELAPAIIALAALACGPSLITGIGHIRHHETDRIAALASNINGIGGAVTELDDGVHIEPRMLHEGQWRSFQDHRMATAGAIIGLAVPGVQIDDIATTAKTLPQFPALWASILAEPTLGPASVSVL